MKRALVASLAVLAGLLVACESSGGAEGGPDVAPLADGLVVRDARAELVALDTGPELLVADAADTADAAELAPLAGVLVEPAALDFGARPPCGAAVLSVVLRPSGERPLVVTGLSLREGSSPDFALDLSRLPNGPPTPASPLTIFSLQRHTILVTYTPDGPNPVDAGQRCLVDEGALRIESESATPLLEVPLRACAVEGADPVPVISCDEGDEVNPQTNLHLRGDGSYGIGGEIRKWEWRVEQPFGSRSVFLPSPTFPNPTFEANVAGRYTFYLDVWDSQNNKSCAPATHEIVVTCADDRALHLELWWHTPGDPDETDTGPFAGADVDLHFIHPAAPSEPEAPDLDGDGEPDPYFSQPYDCYWFNPHPDWGAFGNANDDDPSLDRDDTDGAGPEIVNVIRLEADRTYEIAVHYWNDHGYGPSFATVRVCLFGELVFESAAQELVNHDLWSVAKLHWPSGEVTPCAHPDGEPCLTPNYLHPMFFN